MVREYHKLVRDRVPEILDHQNIKYGAHRAESREEHIRFLLAKVHEEANELEEAITNPNGATNNIIASEFGDLYEVLDELTRELGLDPDHIGEIQTRKREARGGFSEHIILDWTDDNQHSTK